MKEISSGFRDLIEMTRNAFALNRYGWGVVDAAVISWRITMMKWQTGLASISLSVEWRNADE